MRFWCNSKSNIVNKLLYTPNLLVFQVNNPKLHTQQERLAREIVDLNVPTKRNCIFFFHFSSRKSYLDSKKVFFLLIFLYFLHLHAYVAFHEPSPFSNRVLYFLNWWKISSLNEYTKRIYKCPGSKPFEYNPPSLLFEGETIPLLWMKIHENIFLVNITGLK